MSSNPLPTPTPRSLPEYADFWTATGRGELLLPHCTSCETVIWYPRQFCPACGSTELEWVPASGKGTIYTYTIVRVSAAAGYEQATPYVVAYVELVEGPRIMTNIVDCPVDDVRIGMPVTIVFHATESGNALFRFRPEAG